MASAVMLPLLIYIHGFKSSPQSAKAQDVQRYLKAQNLAIDYQVPSLSDYPDISYERLTALIEANQGRRIGLIGSSMGGFMATVLVQRYDLKAVLINPAVRPSEMVPFIFGEHENPYTGERFTLGPKQAAELHALEDDRLLHPEKLFVLLQTGDETLDYRRAVDYYRDCKLIVEEGGDHRFQGFEQHLPAVLEFLALS